MIPAAPGWGALDLSAKLGWRLRYDRRPWLAICQDKLAVRQYAAARGVPSVPLLASAARAADLDFGGLPPECFLKANHGCGYNLWRTPAGCYHFRDGTACVAADGRLALPRHLPALTTEQTQALLDGWLARRYHPHEWAYQQIEPRILVEPVLQPRQPPELLDIRCYTFDGQVAALSLGSPRYRQRGWNAFLTPNWEPIRLSVYREPLPDPLPPPPAELPQMLAMAACLGAGLDFVRVDLYNTRDGPLLGEMTVYPEAGSLQSPTACHAFNCWLASHWPFTPGQRVQACLLQQARWTTWRARRAARRLLPQR